MHLLKGLLLLASALLLGGCLVMSLHPFFTDSDAVFEQALVGVWSDVSGKATLTVKQFGANAYRVIYLQREISHTGGKARDGEPGEFEAHLGKIGSTLFLDLYPDKDSWNRLKNEALAVHLAPTHTISKILLEGDKLVIAGLEHDWLKDLVSTNSQAIAHEKVEGSIVLTASTEALQAFLRKYGAEPNAFRERRRIPSAEVKNQESGNNETCRHYTVPLSGKIKRCGLDSPVFLWLVSGLRYLQRGSGPPSGGSISQFTLVAPRDGATIPLLHRFKWQRIAGSTAYHFFLYEVNRTLVWSALVRDTTLVVPPSVALQRGHAYLWRVEAILPDETTVRSELHAFTLSQ